MTEDEGTSLTIRMLRISNVKDKDVKDIKGLRIRMKYKIRIKG